MTTRRTFCTTNSSLLRYLHTPHSSIMQQTFRLADCSAQVQASGSISTPIHPAAPSFVASRARARVTLSLAYSRVPSSGIHVLESPKPLSALVFHLIHKTPAVLARRLSSRPRRAPESRCLASSYGPMLAEQRQPPQTSLRFPGAGPGRATVFGRDRSHSRPDARDYGLRQSRQNAALHAHGLAHNPQYGRRCFSYQEFKRRIALESLDAKQTAMIELRLHLLDAFLPPGARQIESYFTAGGLVIVDLTDPFLDGLTASVLFDIVLGSFTQWQQLAESSLQYNPSAAHLATRIIIATQEPTVVPPTILDLASVIVCHRFSSPAWCSHLARHVSTGSEDWYKEVMALPTGHALVFSPAAALATDERGGVAAFGSGASQSLPTPPISEAHLPARTSNAFQMSAPASAPVQVATARSPLPTVGSSPTTRGHPPNYGTKERQKKPPLHRKLRCTDTVHLKMWLEENSTPVCQTPALLPSQSWLLIGLSVDLDDELTFLLSATAAEDDNDASLLHHQLPPCSRLSRLADSSEQVQASGSILTQNTPSSAVICGVQGSGKSHTLPELLSALVFHFDTQDAGRPCEAAFLSSPAVHLKHVALPQVTVLCSPSNVNRRRQAYASQAQVRVEPLCLAETDLTADRMLAIMGCDNLDVCFWPLLRLEFKRKIALERLSPQQKAMIELRLHLLDAFIRPGAPRIDSYFTAGGLVLVDLTDPFLDGLTASVLFDIVLGTFIQWQTVCGKLVVLDEAHKYLVNSDSARLNQSISNIIRLQRHLATRIIIATQEPTVVPPTILDLASIIICHRFSSPAWCKHLAQHVSTGSEDWYKEVMALPTGHGLVFSPAAALATDERGRVVLLGRDHLRLRVRPRLTLDGGTSILAVAPIPSLVHLPAQRSAASAATSPGPRTESVLNSGPGLPALPTAGSSPMTRSTPESLPPSDKGNDKGKGKAKESATHVEEGSVFLAAARARHPHLFDTGTSHLSALAVEVLSPNVGAALSLGTCAASDNAARHATPDLNDRDEDENDVYLQSDIRRAMELSLQPNDTPTMSTPGASGASIRVAGNHRAPQPETILNNTAMPPSVAASVPTVAVVALSVPQSPMTDDIAPLLYGPSVAETTDGSRVVPPHLKHLMRWLVRNGATTDTALKLGDTMGALHWVRKKDTLYGALPKSKWWNFILGEAVENGLVELINMDISKKQLKASGQERMIRLLDDDLVYA
ncbi:hypothetical protein B0H14DRAFT_3893911 [Mycena olivaceomarginata]|nr:hypothetical protein B0H14DRAFT_3893911 [Mycena olivaceomarginata]